MAKVDFTSQVIRSIVNGLNEMLATDRDAIEALVEYRVGCNEAMSDHPTVQVGDEGLGMLGVINGLVGAIPSGPRKGWGYITAVYCDDGNLLRFEATRW
jgi:hypothetical protein